MIKVIKKIILGSLSVLIVNFLIWTLFLLKPSLSYAHQTIFEQVTVFHNQDLDAQTETIIRDAVQRIKRSDLFDEAVSIELCLNDDRIYPNLHPFAGKPIAYAMLNKTIIKNCKVDFAKNIAETQWAINNNELRQFDLTWLLAHEFTHNLQYHNNANYVIKSTLGKLNWKLEGHAEYIARAFKNDGQLKEKIDKYLSEESKEHIGLPVFDDGNGTKQILSYYKYALVIQYLMEVKQLSFEEVCKMDATLDDVYSEMLTWKSNQE